MYRTFLGQCIVADGLQRLHGSRTADAHLFGKVLYTGYRAIPHDILDVDIVADEHLGALVDVDDTYQSVALLSEVIQERGVLAERIVPIVGIVGGRLVVTKQKNDAVFHHLLQFVAAAYVRFFAKHLCKF